MVASGRGRLEDKDCMAPSELLGCPDTSAPLHTSLMQHGNKPDTDHLLVNTLSHHPRALSFLLAVNQLAFFVCMGGNKAKSSCLWKMVRATVKQCIVASITLSLGVGRF